MPICGSNRSLAEENMFCYSRIRAPVGTGWSLGCQGGFARPCGVCGETGVGAGRAKPPSSCGQAGCTAQLHDECRRLLLRRVRSKRGGAWGTVEEAAAEPGSSEPSGEQLVGRRLRVWCAAAQLDLPKKDPRRLALALPLAGGARTGGGGKAPSRPSSRLRETTL